MNKVQCTRGIIDIIRSWVLSVDRVIAGGSFFLSWFGYAAVFLLVGMIFVNVFLRYVFNQPYIHADELVRYFNSWIAYMAIAYTFRKGRHVAISSVVRMLPEGVRPKAETLGLAMVAFWAVCLNYGAFDLWIEMFQTKERSFGLLEIQLWIPGLCIIPGMTWFSLEVLVDLAQRLLGLPGRMVEY